MFTHFFETYTDNTIEITDVLETFIAHNGPKFSYTNQKLSNEFFVHANPLLFEQGVREQEIKISRWQTTRCGSISTSFAAKAERHRTILRSQKFTTPW